MPGINRWDKDSIRPGPVGSVGDVNLQVQLKKSAPDLPNRFEKAFSGKNEVWGGSNISDGQYTGFSSGGRGAVVAEKSAFSRTGFKTSVGWRFQNIIPTDRSKDVKMVPLGQFSWNSEKAKIYKAKVTGEQFLPLPGGYGSSSLTRGGAYPVVVAETAGEGVPLPATAVKITDPIFGEDGVIETPGSGCPPAEQAKVWTPALDDPIRGNDPDQERKRVEIFGRYPYREKTFRDNFPPPGNNVEVYDVSSINSLKTLNLSPCGKIMRPKSYGEPKYSPPSRRRKEGDNRPIPKPVPGKMPAEKVQKKQIKR